MALPAPNLDDRKFQDLVDEAKRLIPKYCPEWTNHNLSDPGVALIELFAWMTEMTLFRLNQVPDRYYTKFLELVGIEPFPPSVARTELTFSVSIPSTGPVIIPSGTEVATVRSDEEEVVFTTVAEVTIHPPTVIGALTARASDDERFADVSDRLGYERESITCFTSDPITPGDAFYLGFEESLAGHVIELAISASIEGIGVDPHRPPLGWEVWSGEAWIPVRVPSDTTGGLNRDGVVTLQVPRAHAALTLGGRRGHWLRAVLRPAAPGQPEYQASPRLRTVTASTVAGTSLAEHTQWRPTESIGRSLGVPDQQFKVAHGPVLPRRRGEAVQVITMDGATEWQEVADFAASGADDLHYTWDDTSGVVRFGPRIRYPDGSTVQHGAVPPDGAEIVVSGYRTGGGERGNVGAGTLTVLRNPVTYVDRVTNLVPAVGGVDAETVENTKRRGPMSIRTGFRAVTAGDYERLAMEASKEVARARCLPPEQPGGPVRLLLVPEVRSRPEDHHLDDFALSEPLLERVMGRLDERRVLGTTIEVGTPYYQGVTVAALVKALPGRPATLIRQRVLDLLYRQVNPLVGGISGTGWPFDQDLNAVALAQLIESIDGIDRVEEVLLFEHDLRTGTRHGTGRDTIRLDTRSLFLSAIHQVVVR